MASIPATTNRSASHKGIANRISTAIPFCNAQPLENTSRADSLRNRSKRLKSLSISWQECTQSGAGLWRQSQGARTGTILFHHQSRRKDGHGNP